MIKLKDLSLIFLALFLWSANILVQKIISSEMSIVIINFCRFALMLPALFFIKKPKNPLWQYAVVALFWNVLSFAFQGLGWQAGIEASVSSFLIQTNVFFCLIFSAIFLKKKPKINQLIGMLVTFSGIAFLMTSQISGPIHLTYGILFFIISSACSGLGFTLINKFNFEGSVEDTIWMAIFSWLFFTPSALINYGFSGLIEQIASMSFHQVACILYSGVTGTVIASSIWIGLMKRHSPGELMPFLLLIPAITTLLCVVFIGEVMSINQAISCLIIISGVFICQKKWANKSISA